MCTDGATLQVLPLVVELGPTDIGVTETAAIVLHNGGQKPLCLSPNLFELSPAVVPFSIGPVRVDDEVVSILGPGESGTATVTFTPVVESEGTAMLAISSQNGGSALVSVTWKAGKVLDPRCFREGFTLDDSYAELDHLVDRSADVLRIELYHLQSGHLFEDLEMELWPGCNNPSVDAPGVYELGAAESLFGGCGTRLMAYSDCWPVNDGTNRVMCNEVYEATEGLLTITELSGEKGDVVGSLTDVILSPARGTSDVTTGDGVAWCLAEVTFRQYVMTPRCAENADCEGKPRFPVCSPSWGHCTECVEDTDCGDGVTEYCDPFQEACVATPSCTSDSDCGAVPRRPACSTATHLCVPCAQDTHCNGWNGEYCDTNTSRCVIAPLSVVINEVSVAPTLAEAIELYNPGDHAAPTSGLRLSVTDASGTRLLRITNLPTLAAKGFAIVSADDLRDEAWVLVGNNWLDDASAQVALLLEDGGKLDAVGYGITGDAPTPELGGSTGRVVDGADTDSDGVDFNLSRTPTFGAANDVGPVALGGTFVINELLVDTVGTTGFVELLASGADAASLDGWTLLIGGPAGSDVYGFPSGTTVRPGEFVVLEQSAYPPSAAPGAEGWMHLFDASGARVQSLRWTGLTTDGTTSYGLATDGIPAAWLGDVADAGFLSGVPTKGAGN